ncbi:hypothetical protein BJF83_02040 [Nocardiopsis sp. CNR-923]|nr:hypothetical protein BJF83_02040 [Nocardiopsis sp. CNR-923]
MVGFQDTFMTQHCEPPLTTVRQPTERMGREMARLLVDVAIPGAGESASTVLDTRLVVRDSA